MVFPRPVYIIMQLLYFLLPANLVMMGGANDIGLLPIYLSDLEDYYETIFQQAQDKNMRLAVVNYSLER